MSFKPARLDPPALLLTGAYFCALAIAVLMAIGGVAPLLGLAAAMGGIALACALVAPREYVLEDEGITVKRTLGSLRVEGPLEVETVAARDLIGVKMLLGSGGLFGYLGAYRRAGVRYASALTRRDRALLVRGEGGGVLISPEDADALMGQVASRD